MPEYKEVKRVTGKGYEIHTRYYSNGKVKHQIWYLNGRWHREDGPAYVSYGTDSSVHYKRWYLNGDCLYKSAFTSYEMVKKMKAYSLFTLKELLVLKRSG